MLEPLTKGLWIWVGLIGRNVEVYVDDMVVKTIVATAHCVVYRRCLI